MVSLLLLSLSVWMHASADVYMMYILCAKALTHGSDAMAAGYCSVEPAEWVLEWVLVRVRSVDIKADAAPIQIKDCTKMALAANAHSGLGGILK